jgi:hypothetical protein
MDIDPVPVSCVKRAREPRHGGTSDEDALMGTHSSSNKRSRDDRIAGPSVAALRAGIPKATLAAVVLPPAASRSELYNWLCRYWQEHERDMPFTHAATAADGAAETIATNSDCQTLSFEIVLPYETHRALTQALCISCVPVVLPNQAARLVCYPHAPSFLLLPYWPALDDCYARYSARTTLHGLLDDLEQLKRGGSGMARLLPRGHAEQRQHQRDLTNAHLAIYYDHCH